MNISGNRSGESLGPQDPLVGFDTYVAAQDYTPARRAKVEHVQDQLHHALGIARNLSLVNDMLADAGRPDLVITQKATIDPIPAPSYMLDGVVANSFARKLNIPTSPKGVPVGRDDLAKIANGSYERPDIMGGHFDKPVLARSLVVAPEFMTERVLEASLPETAGDFPNRLEELHAAHTVMRELVDEQDPHAKGVPNYLIR